MSSWYAPNEVGTRIALFYTASTLAGVFSGFLAFAITRMNGLGGLEGWRCLIIVEGIITVFLGLLVPFILLETPELSTHLDADENGSLVLRKQFRDGGATISSKSHKFSRPVLCSVLMDDRLCLSAIIYWCSTGRTLAMKFTMPRMIFNMGYTASKAQLLKIPAYCLGTVSADAACRSSDHFRWCLPFIIVIVAFPSLFPSAAEPWRFAGNGFAIILSCAAFY